MIRIDEPVLQWFTDHRQPWLTPVVQAVTILGGSAFLIPLVLSVGAWWWWRRRSLRPFAVLAAAYAGAFLLSQLIKALAARPRPPAGLAIGHFDGGAFPSGHATQAAAVWAMLAVVLASDTPSRSRKRSLWAAAAALVLAVGVTRLYLGAHWLSDVLAGWAIGALWVFLVLAVEQARAGGQRGGPAAPRNPAL